jgi:hypothetical protein
MKLVKTAASGTLLAGGLLAASLVILGLFAAKPEASPKAGDSNAADPRRPVLLELFTSEGCSSCPPADRLLETFDRTQPVGGAELIVLSEHVDYWNRLGWTDPFSSPLFTQRQQEYVTQFHLDSAYTPQLVVDGLKEVVGSDERGARAAILEAETYAKASIHVGAQRSGADAKVEIQVVAAADRSKVYVALAEDHAQSDVTHGENSGRTLRHVAVVRTLLLTGNTDARGAFTKDLTLPLKEGNHAAWRVVVFLQESGSKHVVGVAQARL